MAGVKEQLAQQSEMHWAVRNDDVGMLRKLLKQDKKLVNIADYDQRTPLHIAASHNCVSVAKILLAEGAGLNAKDRWGNTPLIDAQIAGFREMVRILKDYGAEAHAGSPRGHAQPENVIQVAPPLPSNRDWEIDPSEIEMKDSELIGKGSFGEIRKALWRGTPVAVKTIRPSLSNDRMVVKDFQHEVQLLVKVRHPNIVQFLGAVTWKPPLMLVTEFLAGGDLHQLIRSKETLPPDRIVKCALDIARGMSYLHNRTKPIIHRDLKPRNIILGEDRELKVGDFGLSKLFDVKHMHDVYKMTGETGSYRYMAPEVFEHSPYDKSVDVFSFAMMLYEMFEGVAPFDDKEAYEAATLVARDGARPVMKSTNYPPGMVDLIKRCWSSYTPKRPLFEEIVHELEKMFEEIMEKMPKDRRHLRDILHIRRSQVED
jgi:tRNA A-37 threonylcarbamoyl transferase component Bud32